MTLNKLDLYTLLEVDDQVTINYLVSNKADTGTGTFIYLLSANEIAGRCLSLCWGVSHATISHDALDFRLPIPFPQTLDLGTYPLPQTWDLSTYPISLPAPDIWQSSLETFETCSLEGLSPVLTPSGGY